MKKQVWVRQELYDEVKQRCIVLEVENAALKSAVLAQQTTNMPSMPVCPHASIKWSVCNCRIKSEVNSEMSECDGRGNYTVIGNMGYRYGYPCNKVPGKPAHVG